MFCFTHEKIIFKLFDPARRALTTKPDHVSLTCSRTHTVKEKHQAPNLPFVLRMRTAAPV